MTDIDKLCPAVLEFRDELGGVIDEIQCSAGDVMIDGRGLEGHVGKHEFVIERDALELKHYPGVREEAAL